MTLPDPVLMMVTQPDERLADIVDAAVGGGVNVIQLRDKSGVDQRGEMLSIRRRVGWRALLVVNGQLLDDADGVHLPESSRAIAPRGKLLGRSVHSLEHALCAESEGADYVVAGTIFPSPSHAGGEVAGVALIERICQRVSIPVIAIGGITPGNARTCMDAGAAGVAVLSPLMSAANPRSVAERYWRAIA